MKYPKEMERGNHSLFAIGSVNQLCSDFVGDYSIMKLIPIAKYLIDRLILIYRTVAFPSDVLRVGFGISAER